MKLLLNDKLIIAYCTAGDISGSIEFDGTIPDDFEANFRSSFYMLKDDEIVLNPDYVEPTTNFPNSPTSVQQIIMQQAIIIAQMQQTLMQQGKDIAELKGASA